LTLGVVVVAFMSACINESERSDTIDKDEISWLLACEDKNTQQERDDCYFLQGKMTKDYRVCEEIQNSSIRDSCYFYVVQGELSDYIEDDTLNDSTVYNLRDKCDRISNEDNRDFCYLSVCGYLGVNYTKIKNCLREDTCEATTNYTTTTYPTTSTTTRIIETNEIEINRADEYYENARIDYIGLEPEKAILYAIDAYRIYAKHNHTEGIHKTKELASLIDREC